MIRFILRALVASGGFWLASYLIHGVSVANLTNLLEAGLVLGVLNALVRPLLVLLTLPLSVVTFGLFLFVVNGLVVWFVPFFVRGAYVSGLWPAILTSIVISLVSWVANLVIGGIEDRSMRDRVRV